MAQMSNRVRRDPFSKDAEAWGVGGTYMLDKTRAGKWRIYECHEDYSTVSGGFLVRGKVVRRYDPQAGSLEGKPAEFETKQAADVYAQKWLTPRRGR